MMNKFKMMAFILIMAQFFACSKKPNFIRIDNISINGIKDSIMQIGMDYVVYNPNDVKTKLEESGMSLYYKDSLVGKGHLNKEIPLKANDTIKVPVVCNIQLDKLSQFYPEMLNSNATPFKIKGENKVGLLFNSFTIDVDETIHLDTKGIIEKEVNKNLRQQDNFKIKTVVINSLPGLKKNRFQIIIETTNNLPFDYEINKLQLDFYMNNRTNESVATWNQNEVIYQKSYQKTNIPIEVEVDNFNMLKNMNVSMFFKSKIDLIIAGQVEIKIQDYIFNVPINDTMKVDVKKSIGL